MNSVLSRTNAGFMSAEALFSLAFYIIMVATMAGVGAGVMSKLNTARAVSAVALIRANYQGESLLLGFGAQPTGLKLQKMSHGLVTPHPTIPVAATLSGVGIYSITNRTNPVGFSINVSEIDSPGVCKAVGGVGWGTWTALHKGILLASLSIPSSPAAPGPFNSGVITSKSQLSAICNAATPNTFVQITLILN